MSLVVQTAETQFPSQQKQIDLGWFDEATYRTRLELAGLPADVAAAVAAKTAATRREAGTAETTPVALQCLRGQKPSTPKRTEFPASHALTPEIAAKQSRIRSTKALKASSSKVTDLLATAIAIQEQDAAAAGQIGYMARAMIWASMPHKKIDGAHYKRDNGLASITMLVDPEIGLPYGKLPRLISAWLTREAKRTGAREVLLGRSLSEFAGKLGLSTNGGLRGDTSRLKMQATKLFSTFVSLKAHHGQDFTYKNVALSDEGMLLWNPKKPNEPSLWESTITLSEAFFQECMEYAVPFDLRVLHCLRSPLAIDIYLWLTWRMFILRRPVLIPWISLRQQFGVGYAATNQGMAHFRAEFHRCLHDVHALYSAARLSFEHDGLHLFPSPPHVNTRSLLK